MSRVIALFVVSLIILLLSVPALPADTQTLHVRYSAAFDKVRVVFDLPEKAAVTNHVSGKSIVVTIATPLQEALSPVTLTDPVVKGITVTPDAQGHAALTITLATMRKYQVFTLPADDQKPFRVVVDIPKTFTRRTQRQLSPAITYTLFEKLTDDRYVKAHIISANTKDAHIRLGVVAAIGERETVPAMVTRSGAMCGVNGGYFLDGTRPVGLLKTNGLIRSLPLWHRSAVAFPEHGLPVFGNPIGQWKVTFKDGSSRLLPDWLDSSVLTPTPAARVIPGLSIAQAPANPYGVTAILRDGKVIARPTVAVPLARGDFALHLTGEDAKGLDAQLAVGAEVAIAPVLTPDWGDYVHAVGAGPRLLRSGKLAISGSEERFQADILTGRRARTGIGVTHDGHALLIVVDAPGAYGGGATLEELAGLLKTFGAVEAMNLDGGGSSCLAIGNDAMNFPPNAWIRPVACAVTISETPRTATKRTEKSAKQ